MSLTTKYQRLNQLVDALENFKGYPSSKDPQFQHDVGLGLQTAQELINKVDELNIFDKRDCDLRDVPTEYLFFFNLQFYKSLLINKVVANPEVKAQLGESYYARKSFEALCAFWELVEGYKMVAKPDSIMVQALINSVEPSNSNSRNLLQQNPKIDKRSVKIEREKKKIEIKKRVAILLQKLQTKSQKDEKYIGKENEDEVTEVDDENRELLLLDIQLNILRAIDDIDLIVQELQMLDQMDKLRKGQIELPKVPERKPVGNFVLTSNPSKREELAKGVFKNPFTLPTYTIEEWAEMEMKKGNLPTPESHQLEQLKKKEAKKKEKEEKTEEEEEKERIKKLDWDEWSEGVQKGQGNRNDNYFKRG